MSQITTLITNLAAISIGAAGTGDAPSAMQDNYQNAVMPHRFVTLSSVQGGRAEGLEPLTFGTTSVTHSNTWIVVDVCLFKSVGNVSGMELVNPAMNTYMEAYAEAMADSTEYGYTSNNPHTRMNWSAEARDGFEWGGATYYAVVATHTIRELLNPAV